MKHTKYIFVSGGVISAVGKGITAASISLLLQKRGFTVCPIKCENNLNVDFGTINPIEHGDPFLCFDGLEGDQDLGNYERFLEKEVGFKNFMTMGQLYMKVIQNERDMFYDGEDVEPIPHIVNEIIRRICLAAKESKADFCVVELGGTVGEYENNNGLYYEAARLMALKNPVAHVHVTYVLEPPHIAEPKTKPAQFGIKELMRMGVVPNFIVVRAQHPIDKQRKYKFGLKFGIEGEDIFSAENLYDIHEVPLHLEKQNLAERILRYFKVKSRKTPDFADWKAFTNKLKSVKTKKIEIAIVGKYFGTGDAQLNDSYHALFHAIKYAGVANNIKINIVPINSDKDEHQISELLKKVDGIIVPIGWGKRGVEGKIKAVQFARENKVPYLGLCYGMQLACVEFARNVVGLKDAHTTEVDPETSSPIIHTIPFDQKYQTIKGAGTSMRLGSFPCVVSKNSLAYKIYSSVDGYIKIDSQNGNHYVLERHRHRYEFNNEYRQLLTDAGMIFSGVSPDDFFVEMIELPQKLHPFFVATQAHPEYKTYPLKPHPMFVEFVKACINNNS